LILIDESGLRISCTMLAVSWPIAAKVADLTIWS